MKVAARVKMSSGSILTEEFVVDALETAQEEIETVIERYNIIEFQRYGEDAIPRELIQVLGVVDEDVLNHDWGKQNIYTTKEGLEVWECINCGLVEKRRMGQPPVVGCFPHLVCKTHNKQFSSEKQLERHNKKYHKEQGK